MALATDDQGNIYVLDQVALRVVHVNRQGQVVKEHPLPAATFTDLAVAPDGHLVLLDRAVRRTVLVVDPLTGNQREHSITGTWTPSEKTGLITSLLVQPNGVWLEVDHRYSVQILNAALQPCEHTVRMGRPELSGVGAYVARLNGGYGVTIDRTDGQGRAWQQLYITDEMPITLIRDILSTPGNGLWILYETDDPNTSGPGLLKGQYFDAGGTLTSRVASQRRPSPVYSHRTVALDGHGGVLHMAFDDTHVVIHSLEVSP